jgi:hypothetical protein
MLSDGWTPTKVEAVGNPNPVGLAGHLSDLVPVSPPEGRALLGTRDPPADDLGAEDQGGATPRAAPGTLGPS